MALVYTKQIQGQLCERETREWKKVEPAFKSSPLFPAGESALFSCATDASISGLTATWLKENKPLDDKLADRVKIVAKVCPHHVAWTKAHFSSQV